MTFDSCGLPLIYNTAALVWCDQQPFVSGQNRKLELQTDGKLFVGNKLRGKLMYIKKVLYDLYELH